MFFKEFTCGHRVRQRQVGPLHGDRTVEVGVGPDINQVRGEKGTDEQCGQRLAESLTVQTAQLLPAPGAKQHLHQEDNRHANEHQLPVARQFTLIRVDHQFPHHRVKVKMEMREHFTVYQQ
ncbi:hypothetical protein D3C75_1010950 [compost metagenome]